MGASGRFLFMSIAGMKRNPVGMAFWSAIPVRRDRRFGFLTWVEIPEDAGPVRAITSAQRFVSESGDKPT